MAREERVVEGEGEGGQGQRGDEPAGAAGALAQGSKRVSFDLSLEYLMDAAAQKLQREPGVAREGDGQVIGGMGKDDTLGRVSAADASSELQEAVASATKRLLGRSDRDGGADPSGAKSWRPQPDEASHAGGTAGVLQGARYGCEYLCGFTGSFDEVAQHEVTCQVKAGTGRRRQEDSAPRGQARTGEGGPRTNVALEPITPQPPSGSEGRAHAPVSSGQELESLLSQIKAINVDSEHDNAVSSSPQLVRQLGDAHVHVLVCVRERKCVYGCQYRGVHTYTSRCMATCMRKSVHTHELCRCEGRQPTTHLKTCCAR